jgi:hypothetical protein
MHGLYTAEYVGLVCEHAVHAYMHSHTNPMNAVFPMSA